MFVRALAISVATIPVAIAAAFGFHLASLIYRMSFSSDHAEPPMDVIASSDGCGRIRLRPTHPDAGYGDWRIPGVFGIASAGGYGRVCDILDLGEDHKGAFAVRRYTPLTATITAAEPARLDIYAYDSDPLTAHGIAYRETRYASELGDCKAWRIEGSSSTWVVFVHGRGAHPNEALRILPTLVSAGHPTLAITYRNDSGAPPSPDRRHWFGLTEWRDIEGAAQYALDNGAKGIVLYGYSMGGSIILNFLYQSVLAAHVKGVVLDSPLVDFGATLYSGARARGYPSVAIHYGKAFAGLRFGVQWKRLNYLSQAAQLNAPMLVLHGEKDSLIPAATSVALCRARPDIVRYVGFENAEHARAWNSNPAKYEAEVRSFLRELNSTG